MTAPDFEAKAREIADVMRSCQTHHPDKWMPVFASALRDAHAEGRREGIEEAVLAVMDVDFSTPAEQCASFSWSAHARDVCLTAIRALAAPAKGGNDA